jgi:predicted DNA-binding transcriptional regulator AlpA
MNRVERVEFDNIKGTPQEISAELAKRLEAQFGRSFYVKVYDVGGKLKIVGQEKDSGNDIMTCHDLAIRLQTTVKAVRRMTETRTQRQARFPVPFFKINGKMIRFSRVKIEEWLQKQAAAEVVLPLEKGKKKRK